MKPLLPKQYAWLYLEKSPLVLRTAVLLYGVREIKGLRHNPRILEWARSLGIWAGISVKDDETPWCGTFVGHCVQRAGFALPEISVRASSWLNWGEKQHRAMLGDVLVFSRRGGGHVGFYVGHDELCYHVLGGNQGNAVSIIRIEKYRCSGIRRCPWRYEQPANVRPIALGAFGTISKNEA